MKKKALKGIWRHPKTQNWMARYKGSDGQWVNKSTGTADAEEAERISAGWKLQAERERAQKLSELSPGGISDAVVRAERLARQGRLDAHAAREIINDLLNAAGQETLDAITNRVWCENWQKSKAGAITERTRWKYDQVARNWLEFLARKADRPLEAVTRADAVAYRDLLANEGLAPQTANHTIKMLRSIYAEAVEQGHLGRNPFVGVGKLREDAESARRSPFTVDEVRDLIKAADGDWKGMILLSSTTGLRLMDAARLTWKKLDLREGTIQTKTSKTGAELTLPIHPELKKWLRAQTRGIGAAPVFPSLANKGGPGKNGLSMAFRRLMDRGGISAGVARSAKEEGRGRTTSQKSFHSLRHFAASQFAANGVRAEIARAITGHSDAESHSNYVTADLEAKRAAVNAIRLTA